MDHISSVLPADPRLMQHPPAVSPVRIRIGQRPDARAFRRALGLPQRPSRGGSTARVDRYGDLAECFANERRVLV